MSDEQLQKQTDSNVLAHFIDVVGLIQRSTWRKHKLKVGISVPTESDLPSHEAFVFAVVYFRQLFSDKLLGRAKNTYGKLSQFPDRVSTVNSKYQSAIAAWDSPPQGLKIASHLPGSGISTLDKLPTLSELFECFTYGAHVLHSRAPKSNPAAARLTELLKAIHPHTLLGFLHGGFLEVYGPISAIGARVHQDFNELQRQHGLPAPEVYWQNQLFNSTGSSSASDSR